MATFFSIDYIEKVLKKGHKHYYYDQACNISEHIRFHFEGVKNSIYPYEKENKYFRILIEQRRPNESIQVQSYRKEQYKPITKIPCSKVFTSLKKIPRSHGWKVDFSQSEKPEIVNDDNSAESYLSQYYPVFDSVENWYFDAALIEQLKDPNALILVIPFEYYLTQEELKAIPKNEYLKPIAITIPSFSVIDYVSNSHAVILSNERWQYYGSDGTTVYDGQVYWLIEKGAFHKIYLKQDKTYSVVENFAALPKEQLACFRLGGNLKEVYGVTPCYDSFVSSMLPYLDKAAVEDNDLDAAVTLHLHPTMWYFSGQECSSCRGSGLVIKAGKNVSCPECHGNGRVKHSPYTDIAVKPQEAGTQPIPTPPIGYADKPVEIVKIQSERVKEHIKDALSAINMEFLYEEPLNISGTAKSKDKEETENFILSVAASAAKNIERTIELIIEERYPTLSKQEREKLEPVIMIPETFDLFTSSSLIADLKSLIEADADTNIINAIEVDYVNKKFAGRNDLRDKMILAKQLDPFSGMPTQEKADMILTGAISKEDYILSIYINTFVQRAVDEVKGFAQLDKEKQLAILYKYVSEKMPKVIEPIPIVNANGEPK